jgi:hypothetical protein
MQYAYCVWWRLTYAVSIKNNAWEFAEKSKIILFQEREGGKLHNNGLIPENMRERERERERENERRKGE